MGTVTYKHQPGIEATKGNVPLAGTAHIYTVGKVLWPEEIETFLRTLFVGRTLHVCCGKSRLGDVRLDADPSNEPDIVGDAADMRDTVPDASFETVLCDPPYNGKMQWNHDLLRELIRVASRRVIFQHWFLPARRDGGYKKAHDTWKLSGCYLWQPRTYFGRVQVVSVFDCIANAPAQATTPAPTNDDHGNKQIDTERMKTVANALRETIRALEKSRHHHPESAYGQMCDKWKKDADWLSRLARKISSPNDGGKLRE